MLETWNRALLCILLGWGGMPATAQEAADVVELTEPGQTDEPGLESDPGAAVEVEPVPAVRVLPQAMQRTVSSSKQFHIFAPTQRLRGAFAVFAEEVKRDYLRVQKASDDWGYPIVIQVVADRVGSGGEAVRSRTEVVAGAGFRFLIRAELTPEFSRDGLRDEIVRMLLAEQVLRGYESGSAMAGEILPAWLHAGVTEAMGYRRIGRASGVFASIMDRGMLMDIEDLYRGNPKRMDSVTEALWRASSGALVLTLLGQPNGAERFQTMLGSLASGGGDIDFLLRKSFPGFRASRNGIEKWWALQVATMARPTVFELLGAETTEQRLAEALQIYYPEEELETGERIELADQGADGGTVELPTAMTAANGWRHCDITEFEKIIGRRDIGRLVKRNQVALLSLELRAFQLARPLVAEYRKLMVQIGEGKTKGLAEKLRLLAARRADLLSDAKAVDDYMNWFEATQSKALSGEFDRYFELEDRLRSSGPRRMNAISRALDEMEQERE